MFDRFDTDGIRAGNVFVDTAGTRNRMLELIATYQATKVTMGGELSVPAGQSVSFTASVQHMAKGTIELIRDGVVIRRVSIGSPMHSWSFENGTGCASMCETPRVSWDSSAIRSICYRLRIPPRDKGVLDSWTKP